MRRTALVLAAVGFAAALPFAASLALAQPGGNPARGPHAKERGPGARMEAHLLNLGLDANQMEKVRAVLDASGARREEIRGRLRRAFDDMHALLREDLPEEAAVMIQAQRIGEINTEGHQWMLHTLLAVRAELTPAQRAQLAKEMRDDGSRHGRRGDPELLGVD